ncbi:MAG: hypothetical protein K9M03_02095 [Kiritimatiellales bacterium]|nr:hypothetical protein [Kiritimatiellales bacterium]
MNIPPENSSERTERIARPSGMLELIAEWVALEIGQNGTTEEAVESHIDFDVVTDLLEDGEDTEDYWLMD